MTMKSFFATISLLSLASATLERKRLYAKVPRAPEEAVEPRKLNVFDDWNSLTCKSDMLDRASILD